MLFITYLLLTLNSILRDILLVSTNKSKILSIYSVHIIYIHILYKLY